MKVGRRDNPPGQGQRVRVPEQVTEKPPATVETGGGTGRSTGDTVPEADVEFETTGGHAHSGTDSTPVTLAGDVTGDNTAAVVEKILGFPVTAPVAGDDEKFLSYEHTGTQLVWQAAPGGGSGSTAAVLGAWVHSDISTLLTSDAPLPNRWDYADSAGPNLQPFSGFVTGLYVQLPASIGAAGNDLIVTVYILGSASAAEVTIEGGAGGGADQNAKWTGSEAFSADYDIEVHARRVGSPAVVRCKALVYGYYS